MLAVILISHAWHLSLTKFSSIAHYQDLFVLAGLLGLCSLSMLRGHQSALEQLL